METKVISCLILTQDKELAKFTYENLGYFSKEGTTLLKALYKFLKNEEPIAPETFNVVSDNYQALLQDAMDSDERLTPKLVLKEFKRNRARNLANNFNKLATQEEFLDNINKIKDIFTETESKNKYNLKELTKNFKENYGKKDFAKEIKTRNWLEFNKSIKPVPTDITLICGRPASGKTALVISLMLEYARNKKKGIFFSVEMSEDQLTNRMIAQTSGIPLSAIQAGDIRESAMDDLNRGIAELENLSPYIDIITGNATTDSILDEVRDSTPDYIVIDYLQLLSSSLKLSDRTKEVAQVSIEIKRIAVKHKIPIIGICQLSRAVESRTDKHPILSDLKETSQLEQDASIVAGVYREAYYNPNCENKTLMEVGVIKNRNGPLSNLKFSFIGFNQRITPTIY